MYTHFACVWNIFQSVYVTAAAAAVAFVAVVNTELQVLIFYWKKERHMLFFCCGIRLQTQSFVCIGRREWVYIFRYFSSMKPLPLSASELGKMQKERISKCWTNKAIAPVLDGLFLCFHYTLLAYGDQKNSECYVKFRSAVPVYCSSSVFHIFPFCILP